MFLTSCYYSIILLLANIILSNYQKKIAKKFNNSPGQEILQGIESAKNHSCELILADRSIQTTFLRIWRKTSLSDKFKLFISFLFAKDSENEEQDLTNVLETDNLEDTISCVSNEFPQIAETLIYERDQYLAYKIKTAPGKKVVAVVGAAHVPGIQKEIFKHQDFESLNTVPKPSLIMKGLVWIIPVSIVLLLMYGFSTNYQIGFEMLTSWVLWNSVLASFFIIMA